MTKTVARLLAAAMLTFFAPLMTATAAEFTAGKEYLVLDNPQPTRNPEEIEVIEFFWYGCPHCYSFEPHLQKWLSNKPEDVDFIREPAVFNKTWAAHARAFFTAEALGISDKTHGAFFDAIQNRKQSLKSEDELAEFFAAFGIDREQFLKAYNSFIVHTRMNKTKTMGPRYRVSGVPTLIVNGKYAISGTTAKSYANMIEVLDFLIAREKAAQ